jgi:hypothetical protein
MEVYVRAFAAPDAGKWQVSPNGGVEAWWSPKGDELFYVSTATRQLMSVRVAPAPTWTPSPAAVVFKEPYFWGTTAGAAAATFDVAADGRLLMIRNASDPEAVPSPTNLVVVQHWFDELARLLP